jgi:hypothetical protein
LKGWRITVTAYKFVYSFIVIIEMRFCQYSVLVHNYSLYTIPNCHFIYIFGISGFISPLLTCLLSFPFPLSTFSLIYVLAFHCIARLVPFTNLYVLHPFFSVIRLYFSNPDPPFYQSDLRPLVYRPPGLHY